MNTASVSLLHAVPSAGYDEPFEMLRACHERVERMLGLLERLADHLSHRPQGVPDETAVEAARDVMRYFDQAGPAHHEDEERHVLPRLVAAGQTALAERLHQDHLRLSELWASARCELARVATGQALAEPLPASWSQMATLYRAHIRVEETEAYRAVEAELLAQSASEDQLREMGREMAGRRGLSR